ncbi:zf-HC2 domain-containing protein [Nakamurella leprariae]|uniref:Zf-HC2 domain-containing protein n=1 Tax=Nakamurella leprariae TaxID=2803911 RepID=A0A938YHH6_9ACTN|nr:zf-HC2 domain-containing protein [Nakamurella leprariae]MBM9467900.1 zf-HC2 domain-containing protein [Nakamurella leprariae]
MSSDDHRTLRELLGAFALGQLSDGERLAVQAHLDGCAECRAELAELQPVVAALSGLDPDSLGAPARPPAQLEEAVLTSVRAELRQRARSRLLRRAGTGLLAAAIVVGVFVLGLQLRPAPSTPTPPPVVPMAVQQLATGVQAGAGLVRHTWGTELKLTATGLDDGGAYTVTFVRADGSTVPGGTFLGTGDNTLTCSLNGALPLDQTAEIIVTDAAGELVLDAVPV